MLATEHAHCVGGVSVISVFTLCGHVGADVAMCEDDKGCVCVCVCACACVCSIGHMFLVTNITHKVINIY